MKSLQKIDGLNVRKTDDGLFSVIDVIKELTGYNNNYAGFILRRIKADSEAVHTNLCEHKFEGKGQRNTPVANREIVINILQMLPGIAGDKFRAETAKVLLRYLDADLSLAEEIIGNSKESDEKKKWAGIRIKGKAVRNQFTSVLAHHGVNKEGFRDCTNAIYRPLFGGDASLVREKVGVPEKANPRDAMTSIQLSAVMIAEESAGALIEKQDRYGNWECQDACEKTSSIMAKALFDMEKLANSPKAIHQ